jgi:hypothetical protein
MSANNGNRSRFHINRKRRIARAIQTRSLKEALAARPESAAAPDQPAAKASKPAAAPDAN